jgi:hypothetical protein
MGGGALVVMVQRPGQRVLTMPGYGLSVARQAGAAAALLTNFFSASYTGTRNNHSGYTGYQFTPAQDLSLLALGRSVSTAITQTHKVRVYSMAYDVLAEVDVSGASPVDALGYAYERLGTPLALVSGTPYILVSREYAGGDLWRTSSQLEEHSAVAAINCARWGLGDDPPTGVSGITDTGDVPPTFFY